MAGHHQPGTTAPDAGATSGPQGLGERLEENWDEGKEQTGRLSSNNTESQVTWELHSIDAFQV
jgi:hypothetical protein